MTDFTTNFNTIQFDGASFVIGSETVNVLWRDSDSNIFLASGTTVPTDATAGYGVGALFIDTDASSGSILFINEGTAASCDFNSVTVPTALTLAGDVTGDSDENTVAKINGVALGTTTATSGNVLTANGTNWATATPDGAGLVDKASAQTITGAKTFGTDKKLLFRDSAISVNSSADGQLDLLADGVVKITTPSAINTGVLNYAETAGTAPAYTLAVPITALVDGAMVMFKTNGASTDDDATLNVNSLGAKPLCKASTGAQITDAGALVDNGVYIAIYSTDVVVDGGWMVQGV